MQQGQEQRAQSHGPTWTGLSPQFEQAQTPCGRCRANSNSCLVDTCACGMGLEPLSLLCAANPSAQKRGWRSVACSMGLEPSPVCTLQNMCQKRGWRSVASGGALGQSASRRERCSWKAGVTQAPVLLRMPAQLYEPSRAAQLRMQKSEPAGALHPVPAGHEGLTSKRLQQRLRPKHGSAASAPCACMHAREELMLLCSSLKAIAMSSKYPGEKVGEECVGIRGQASAHPGQYSLPCTSPDSSSVIQRMGSTNSEVPASSASSLPPDQAPCMQQSHSPAPKNGPCHDVLLPQGARGMRAACMQHQRKKSRQAAG